MKRVKSYRKEFAKVVANFFSFSELNPFIGWLPRPGMQKGSHKRFSPFPMAGNTEACASGYWAKHNGGRGGGTVKTLKETVVSKY